MQYLVNSNLKHNGTRYVKGDIVDVDDESAAPLVADGVLKVATGAQEQLAEESQEVSVPDPLVVTPAVSEPAITVQPQPAPQPSNPTPEDIAATIASIDSSNQQPQPPVA